MKALAQRFQANGQWRQALAAGRQHTDIGGGVFGNGLHRAQLIGNFPADGGLLFGRRGNQAVELSDMADAFADGAQGL